MADLQHGYPSIADRHIYPSSVPLGLHSTPARVYNEAPEPLVITIVVPDEAAAGNKLVYAAPDGQELSLTVPPNVPPGSLMTLTQDPVTRVWRCVAEEALDSGPAAPVAPFAAPEPRREEQELQPLMFTIRVPDGAYPGMKLHHVAPDGQDLRLTVPESVPPGSQMILTLDRVTRRWKCIAEPVEPVPLAQLPRPCAGPPPGPQPVGQAPTMTTFVRQDARQLPVNLSYVPPVVAGEPWQHPRLPAAASFASPVAASYVPPPLVLQQHPSYTPPAAASYVPSPQQASSYVPALAMPAQGSYVPPAVVVSYVPPPAAIVAEHSASYTPLPEVLPGVQPQLQVRSDTPRFAPVAHPVMAIAAQSQSHGVSCKMPDGSSMNLPPIGMNLPPLFRPQMCVLPPLRSSFQGGGPARDLGIMAGPAVGGVSPLRPPPMPRMPMQMELALAADPGPMLAL